VIRIRPAFHVDLPWLIEQLKAFDEFVASRQSLFGADAPAMIEKLVADQVVLIAEGEERHGCIGGTLAPHPFNSEIVVLTEMFWWVMPEHHGTSAGARLLQAFTAYGQENADWIIMTLEAKSPVNPANLERKGFALLESSYLLETAIT